MENRSLRSPLGRVRGWGSARSGTHHWWLQRVTSLGLCFVFIFLLYRLSFLPQLSYDNLYPWVRNPFNGTTLGLFMILGIYHGQLGLQTIMEDYIHSSGLKHLIILMVKGVSFVLGVMIFVSLCRILSVSTGT
jgi:succinate dehydrogenase / fumarate reductase membrane anchor subunit